MESALHQSLVLVANRFPGRRVLVVGDFMLDRYVFGDAERISPEAPVPVLRVVERQDRVGGAGSVSLNVLALGASVVCAGVLGRDAFGDRVRTLLSEAGADIGGLCSVADRPTITKTRLIGLAEHRHRQQILRVDDEDVRPLPAEDRDRLLDHITSALREVDAVCLEDYAKGLITPELSQAVIAMARELGKPVLVDPARVGWEKYDRATLLTPNRAEFEHRVGRPVPDAELPSAAAAVIAAHHLDALVITLGRDGALLVRRDGSAQRFPTTPRAVYDNTGAGDAVLAMMAVATAAGATLEQAVVLANIAGGLEVSKFGCVPIARAEVLHELHHGPASARGKIRSLNDLPAELDARRQRGETVVFTNGVFDLLHAGHVDLLERAKALGSALIVAVNSDSSVRRLAKGADRPIRSQADRARLLAALSAVDYVLIFDEPDPCDLLRKLRPEVLVKGGDYTRDQVVGWQIVDNYGGRVEVVPFLEGYGTTSELDRIRARG